VVGGWLLRVIALFSIAIRIAVALQAAPCSAMLAALVLEKEGVAIRQAPHVLMLRAVWVGPHTPVHVLYRQKGRSKYILVGIVLVVLTMGSQFSLTPLLSDLVNIPIHNGSTQISVPLANSVNWSDISPGS
jgi:hypothetical protein